jgi:hypothetical protein
MKNVTITDTRTGKEVFTYPISIQGVNYDPSNYEYDDMAWSNAVADNLVKAEDRAHFSFRIS